MARVQDVDAARWERSRLPPYPDFGGFELITNRSIHARCRAMILVATMTGLAGCGPGNGLNLAKVSGKVLYKGQPVKNGTVFFMADETKGTVGPPAVGSITSDGSYVMSTESAGDGVIVGHHKVGITGVELVSVSSQEEYDPEKDAGGYMKAKSKAAAQAGKSAIKKDEELFTDKGGKKYRYVVPMKYSRPEESGIFVKIDGSQTVNFDIDESGTVRINP
jgi:hypothetical protein